MYIHITYHAYAYTPTHPPPNPPPSHTHIRSTEVGEVRRVLVQVLVGDFTISLGRGANILSYYAAPSVDLQNTTPDALPVGAAPVEQVFNSVRTGV